jgi:Putative MetA-pathway of phenol degradation
LLVRAPNRPGAICAKYTSSTREKRGKMRIISALVAVCAAISANSACGQFFQESILTGASLQTETLDTVSPSWNSDLMIRGQNGKSGGGGGGGDLAAAANNPTSDLTIFQIQNTFVPSTYEASGFSHTLGLQLVKPFKTGWDFFPTWVTRSTLPVITTADPDGSIPIGPPNDGDFSIPLDNQSGLGDFTFISILNHPTDWGSLGIGPGFMAPCATQPELGEQSWKFSPTFVAMYTAIEKWQFGLVGYYNFPLDDRGSKSLLFQPIIVRQLGDGWFTGWGDDLWSFNTESGNFTMPLQLRLGKVHTICGKPMNIFVTGNYTPDDFHKGPAPEWSMKLSVSYLFPGK